MAGEDIKRAGETVAADAAATAAAAEVSAEAAAARTQPVNFIQNIINEEREAGLNKKVHTRFPPEPNGYLHIGHAKSICLNFGLAQKNNGLCNLRFDDTNPSKEEVEYMDSIKEDVHWLGFDWEDREYHASDYFEEMYEGALKLIRAGKAYVCDLSPEQMRQYRGTLTEPGQESPYRTRSVEENLELFAGMKNGEFPDGSRVLRAKIDMASTNLNMRDPVIYRILHKTHNRTGDEWCIYPMYDFAHPISDAIEKITYSVCTVEFEAHRPLYNWVVENLGYNDPAPRQIEFARLNVNHTVMSKRKLRELVEEGLVASWDDPRMPTISGIRRRGYTPEAIRSFCEEIGVAKSNSVVDIGMLEHCLREDLKAKAPRLMAVLRPLKVTLLNYPENKVEMLPADNNAENPAMGLRQIPFSREIYIEADDFMEDPPKKFFRLALGREVRLKHAYIIKCEEIVKDEAGNVIELLCTYDPDTKSGEGSSERKVKGTLHWVSAGQAVTAEIRLYDHLLKDDEVSAEGEAAAEADWKSKLNPDSLVRLTGCKVEPLLGQAEAGDKFQFLRQGYFCADYDGKPGQPVFNRIVALRDSWAKIKKDNNK